MSLLESEIWLLLIKLVIIYPRILVNVRQKQKMLIKNANLILIIQIPYATQLGHLEKCVFTMQM